MTEAVLHKVQLGRQSVLGTGVAATTVFPVDAGFLGFELDRGTESPDEDFGRRFRQNPGRESHGVRWATASLPFVARFEDIAHVLEMHVGAISGGTPTGTASPFTYGYAYDETTAGGLETLLKPYTLQYGVPGSTQDEWRGIGVLGDSLELGFDALTAPGNSMWKGTLGLVAVDRGVSSMTGSLSAPATLETMEGHLTTLAEGSTSTAFASLSALSASLKQFQLRSNQHLVGRAYGGSSDTATTVGQSDKPELEFSAQVAIGSTAKSDIHDIYNVTGSVASERRWRIQCTGSGVNTFTIDGRVRFHTVNIEDNEGERLYGIEGVFVYDSTLVSRGKYTLVNAVATIP